MKAPANTAVVVSPPTPTTPSTMVMALLAAPKTIPHRRRRVSIIGGSSSRHTAAARSVVSSGGALGRLKRSYARRGCRLAVGATTGPSSTQHWRSRSNNNDSASFLVNDENRRTLMPKNGNTTHHGDANNTKHEPQQGYRLTGSNDADDDVLEAMAATEENQQTTTATTSTEGPNNHTQRDYHPQHNRMMPIMGRKCSPWEDLLRSVSPIRPSSPGRRVRFCQTLTVHEIESHRSFTKEEKVQIWTSPRVIRLQARRNVKEWIFEGTDYHQAVEEHDFVSDKKGNKLHPAHWKPGL